MRRQRSFDALRSHERAAIKRVSGQGCAEIAFFSTRNKKMRKGKKKNEDEERNYFFFAFFLAAFFLAMESPPLIYAVRHVKRDI
jgi:hypothetical protein